MSTEILSPANQLHHIHSTSKHTINTYFANTFVAVVVRQIGAMSPASWRVERPPTDSVTEDEFTTFQQYKNHNNRPRGVRVIVENKAARFFQTSLSYTCTLIKLSSDGLYCRRVKYDLTMCYKMLNNSVCIESKHSLAKHACN